MVLGTAVCKGELGVLWAFSEDEFITPADDGEEEGSDDDKKEAKDGDKAKAEKKVADDKQKASWEKDKIVSSIMHFGEINNGPKIIIF